MIRLVLILGLLGGLAACGPAPAAHDVAFYKANADARKAQVAKCSNDASSAGSPECLNALQADAQTESQRALQYSPPPSRVKSSGSL